MKISLSYNYGLQWYFKDDISFKGYFHINDTFYDKQKAADFLADVDNLKTILKTINGVFTILKKDKNEVTLISDITRSFPIFYTKTNDDWFLADDIYTIINKLKTTNFNQIAEREFLASNHVHGRKTLIEGIYQLQSSEYILFDNSKIKERYNYFSYSNSEQKNKDLETLQKECIKSFKNSFKRTLKSIKNKQIILPLSSGFDSRLIAVFLKKYNLNNVLCYTYGKKDSFEIAYSKKVANTLGFEWIFIEYDEKLINKNLDTKEFKKYINYAGKLISMPNLQEYFAVKFLKENNFINDNAIFLSGYAGDILGGSEFKFLKDQKLTDKNISARLFDSKMKNTVISKLDKKDHLKEFENILFSFDKDFKHKIPETVFDDYNLKERISKYIFNSASFYNFFGYEIRFPFWDLELLNFFKELPIKYKIDKSFFDKILQDNYFEKFDVNFETVKKSNRSEPSFKGLKKIIKSFLPTFIREKRMKDRDWNNYELVTKNMITQMKLAKLAIHRTYNDYNEIVTQWYLYKIKGEL